MHITPHPTPRSALAEIPLLTGANSRQIAELVLHTDVISVPAGTVLERAGSSARQLLHVLCGTVRATCADGSTTNVAEGSAIGVTELITGAPHRATYITTRATVLVVVFGPPAAAVLRELGTRPVAGRIELVCAAPALGVAS